MPGGKSKKSPRESDLIEECIFALRYSPLSAMFAVFDSIVKAKKGRIPIPQNGDIYLDNHAVSIYGYSREERVFYFINSWGVEWGDNGKGALPFEYFSKKGWVLGVSGIIDLTTYFVIK